jgi:hypothetical protein
MPAGDARSPQGDALVVNGERASYAEFAMTDRDDELLAAARSSDARALERLLEKNQAAPRGIREFRGRIGRCRRGR